MKIGFYSYYDGYNHNQMFLTSKSPIGDDLGYFTVYLYEFLIERGHEVSTLDEGDINSFDKVVFFDMPKKNNKYYNLLLNNNQIEMYLFLFESHLIMPRNFIKKNHKYFKKIFTWKDDLIDFQKYFRFYLPVKFNSNFDNFERNKFCTLIASNKFSISNKNELYSERIKAIRWFEKHAHVDFDLYGHGWEKGELNSVLKLIFSHNWIFKKLFDKLNSKILNSLNKPFSSYRGKASTKAEVLSKYKFAICYENFFNMNSYITEKLFDCFSNGCIPIYLGAGSIEKFIPKTTFIDKRDFNTYNELYAFLKNMPDETYDSYQNEIKFFLNGPKAQLFSAEYFANNFLENILKHE